ncbi:DUF4214 domain-containing protein [Ruminococcaceae bacterium OttesenSCG-928-A16]|nr:DUF4214 domain-containing protein [Ruminococcaceae bacterium OttesenSCG-928-A16]
MRHTKLLAKIVAGVLTTATLFTMGTPVFAAAVPGEGLYFTETDTSSLLPVSSSQETTSGDVSSTPDVPAASSESSSASSSTQNSSTTSETSVPPAQSVPVSSSSPASSSPSSSPSSSTTASTPQPNTKQSEPDNVHTTASSTGVRGFVERLYTLVMDRPGEVAGVNFWVNEITSGRQTAAQVIHFFFNGPEFATKNTTNNQYLTILYRTMMNREPDAAGLANWLEHLNNQVSRNFVLHEFVILPEFTGICAQYGVTRGDFPLTEERDQNPTITAFVNRLYLNCMGRPGDAAGLNNWASLLRKGQTAASVVDFFFNSPEFTNKNLSNLEFIKAAYRTLFGRQADKAGYEYWLSILNSGVSKNYILSQFINSPEFIDACNVAGINRGGLALTENRDKNLGITGFVNQLYLAIFNRTGDANGLNYNTGLLLNKQSALSIISGMLAAPEFVGRNLSEQDVVKIMYRAIFNREADPSGLAHYTGLLGRGVSPLYVLSILGASAEFAAACQKLGIVPGHITLTQARDQNIDVTDVAMNAYRALFNRTADVNGLNALCTKLLTKNKQTTIDALFALTTAAEFTGRNLNANNYVAAVFTTLCGRAPTEAEIASWVTLLSADNAANRKSLFYLLTNSQPCYAYLGPKLGIPTFNQQERGIDVSKHNKAINWAQVAAQGYTFAMIRVVSTAEGEKAPSVDPYFYQNVRGARAAGLKVGAYIYSYARTNEYASAEVTTALNAIKAIEKEGYRFEYPIAMDIEEINRAPYWNQVALLTLAIIDQRGYYPCLYSFANGFKNTFDMNALAGYDLWVAHWVSNPETTTMSYPGAIWQHSNSGSVIGVNGRCDLNISYKDFAKVIREAGKNNLK